MIVSFSYNSYNSIVEFYYGENILIQAAQLPSGALNGPI